MQRGKKTDIYGWETEANVKDNYHLEKLKTVERESTVHCVNPIISSIGLLCLAYLAAFLRRNTSKISLKTR